MQIWIRNDGLQEAGMGVRRRGRMSGTDALLFDYIRKVELHVMRLGRAIDRLAGRQKPVKRSARVHRRRSPHGRHAV